MLVMTARQAFCREEMRQWQHACKTLRKKKKIPRACYKKKPGVGFHSRTADAPYEAAMSIGALLLLPAAQVAAGKQFRDPPVDRQRKSHGLEVFFRSKTNDFHRQCLVSGRILFALWI